MAAATFSPEVMAKIKSVTAQNYALQAQWYLNAFWSEGAEAEAETVWGLAEAFAKEDHIKGKEGNELNAVQAFSVLQKRNQTLTALELKAQLRKVDIDANGEMALCEYLIFINGRDPVKFATNPQGEVDKVKLAALEAKMAELDAKFQDLQAKEVAAKKAEAEAKAAAAAAKIAEEAAMKRETEAKAEEVKAKAAKEAADAAAAKAKAAEDELRVVEEEARTIAAEIKREEDAKAAEVARLEALSTDQTVGIVKRNMAVQQLAAAKNEDPLPLRKAKLTQEAVVRKLAKATAAAAEETAKSNAAAQSAKDAAEAATAAANAAEQARKDAVAAREAADAAQVVATQAVEELKAALAEVEVALQETEEELTVLRNSPTAPMGKLWWQSRILEEKKKSLPTRMW